VENKKEAPQTTENVQNVALLQASLNSDPNPPQGGADITIVDGSALFADNNSVGGLEENQSNQPSSDQISLYVVREGDSLSQIADMFDVTVNTIRWNNDITGSTINPGQTLVILPVSGVRHTVKSKDTLASIAKRYKGDLEEIKRYNDITEDTKLAIGDVVIIPDGEVLPQPSQPSANSSRTTLVSAQVSVDGGYYIRPTTGKRTQGIHGYNAVDIAPPTGTSIVAAADGKVIISRTSGWNGGYGSYVVVEHPNGTQTLYAHMSENIASQGSSVVQGQVLGYVGMTGKATGPHLHFEIRGAKNPF
jgi:murein DD-endopeptidase MepM/ murein hydrolase activator NlpD